MTTEEKVKTLSYMTDETDNEMLLTYLNLAKDVVFELAYPYGGYPEEMPDKYNSVQLEIAAYMINKRGAEGEVVHLENGISRHWEKGNLPPSLITRITPMVGVL